jgi:hypothetical protein
MGTLLTLTENRECRYAIRYGLLPQLSREQGIRCSISLLRFGSSDKAEGG